MTCFHFVQCYICVVYPCFSIELYIVHSYWCMAFVHCTNRQLFIYPSNSRWNWVLSSLGLLWTALLWTSCAYVLGSIWMNSAGWTLRSGILGFHGLFHGHIQSHICIYCMYRTIHMFSCRRYSHIIFHNGYSRQQCVGPILYSITLPMTSPHPWSISGPLAHCSLLHPSLTGDSVQVLHLPGSAASSF